MSSESPKGGAEPAEFARLYIDLYPRLTVIAASITGDRSNAEDVVQQAAMIAVEKSHQFAAGSSFAAWIAQIVRRCALNQRRKTRSRKTYAADPTVLAQLTDGKPAPGASSSFSSVTGEIPASQTSFDDQVVDALNGLSQQARSCLLLRTVEKLSYAEISELMQIPAGTAMSHVHRSKAALRRRLESSANHRPAPSRPPS